MLRAPAAKPLICDRCSGHLSPQPLWQSCGTSGLLAAKPLICDRCSGPLPQNPLYVTDVPGICHHSPSGRAATHRACDRHPDGGRGLGTRTWRRRGARDLSLKNYVNNIRPPTRRRPRCTRAGPGERRTDGAGTHRAERRSSDPEKGGPPENPGRAMGPFRVISGC